MNEHMPAMTSKMAPKTNAIIPAKDHASTKALGSVPFDFGIGHISSISNDNDIK